jgi:hypothetical protein
LIRIAVSPAPTGHQGHPAGGQRRLPAERNARDQYLLWLNYAEANRLAAMRRYGESYSDAVIRMAKARQA